MKIHFSTFLIMTLSALTHSYAQSSPYFQSAHPSNQMLAPRYNCEVLESAQHTFTGTDATGPCSVEAVFERKSCQIVANPERVLVDEKMQLSKFKYYGSVVVEKGHRKMLKEIFKFIGHMNTDVDIEWVYKRAGVKKDQTFDQSQTMSTLTLDMFRFTTGNQYEKLRYVAECLLDNPAENQSILEAIENSAPRN